MRQLTDHIVTGDSANHQLEVTVTDEPGQGGACHGYVISGFDVRENPANFVTQSVSGCPIVFQNGPIKEAGINGVTHEALLAILIDRMRSFQAGPYHNEHNQNAMRHLEAALYELQARTRERIARAVEGTHEK